VKGKKVRDKGLFEERIRKGESTEQFIRRALRKLKKEGIMEAIRDPSRGTGECRNISKRSLKREHKEIQAERRRFAEAARRRKRQRQNRNK
tara:strand:+ start:218 stop:490 length:273 start_codon:yes stop_codon:yes gene_type:complete